MTARIVRTAASVATLGVIAGLLVGARPLAAQVSVPVAGKQVEAARNAVAKTNDQTAAVEREQAASKAAAQKAAQTAAPAPGQKPPAARNRLRRRPALARILRREALRVAGRSP